MDVLILSLVVVVASHNNARTHTLSLSLVNALSYTRPPFTYTQPDRNNIFMFSFQQFSSSMAGRAGGRLSSVFAIETKLIGILMNEYYQRQRHRVFRSTTKKERKKNTERAEREREREREKKKEERKNAIPIYNVWTLTWI